MAEINRRVWCELRPHREYTLPLLSIVGNHGSTRCGLMMYGDTQIEDLWVPFFCVSSNLTTASMQVHRRGSLLWAVTASSSLPGFAVPVLQDRHLLVDGALFNNLPGDIVRELGGGHLMVSRVSVDDDQALTYDTVPLPGDVVRKRILRRPVRYPRLMEVVLRSVMLASINREQAIARGAEFCFQPPVEAFGLMQFDALESIAETGYRYAMERIAQWREAGALKQLMGATVS
jgi:predicted acylesterase/phospholipase RssA